MKIIATKTKKKRGLVFDWIIGVFLSVFVLLIFVPPLRLIDFSSSTLSNKIMVWLVFAVFALFMFIAPITSFFRLFVWHSLPDVLVESDGIYLYIHGKKKDKYKIFDLKNAQVMAIKTSFNLCTDFRYSIYIIRPKMKAIKIHLVDDPTAVVRRLENEFGHYNWKNRK